jgi:hypothetical protein
MAANATNIPGAAAPDAEIKGNMQIARIRRAEADDAKSNFQH